MPLIRATVVLQMDTGVARDEARNVWHFATGAFPPDDYIPVIGEALEAYYDSVAPYLSPLIRSSGAPIGEGTIVEMATVDFRSPGAPDDVVSEIFATRTMGLPIGGTGGSLPQELAVAHSFRGNIEGVPEEAGVTRPRSRRRGRVFIGPFSTAALGGSGGATPRPTPVADLITVMLAGYTNMLARLGQGTRPAQHVVYSPTTGDRFPVVHHHVDDAWDIIRSRGTKAGGRTEAAVNQPPLV